MKGEFQGTCLEVSHSELSIEHGHQMLWVFELKQGSDYIFDKQKCHSALVFIFLEKLEKPI